MDKRLELAYELYNRGDYDKALKLAEEPLENKPDAPEWLIIVVCCLGKLDKLGIAYQLCRRIVELVPKNPVAWLNMCDLEMRLWMVDESIRSARKGLQFAAKDKDKLMLLVNLSCVYVDIGKFDEALKYLGQAAKIDPTSQKIISNTSFCQLAQKNWAEGWKSYHKAIGQLGREPMNYVGEPEWDGTPGKRVVLYGEQGVGDQICFSSIVPDAAKDISIILDVHPKLKHLLQRSFPDVVVYGTHMMPHKKWDKADREFDASFPMGQLGEFYRLTDDSFPRKPFLIPDPDRVLMWKQLFSGKLKPVIGIGWTGGIPRTGRRFRISTLEDWLPLFKAIDAHWVSLEYKPAGKAIEAFVETHGVDLKEYPYATLTEDYDDTAAMVAALDCVVSVPTTVGHLAGAMGVPNIWLQHKYKCWKAASGLPFHPTTAIVDWEGSWRATVSKAIEPVRSTLGMTRDSHLPITRCDTASRQIPVALSA